MADSLPNPGSDAALELGCRCPVMDNGHGRDDFAPFHGKTGEPCFWVTADCPIHGELAGKPDA